MSLISSKVFEEIRTKTNLQLQKTKVNLQTAGGNLLQVRGSVILEHEVGKEKLKHQFIVVKDLNRKLFWGKTG